VQRKCAFKAQPKFRSLSHASFRDDADRVFKEHGVFDKPFKTKCRCPGPTKKFIFPVKLSSISMDGNRNKFAEVTLSIQHRMVFPWAQGLEVFKETCSG
jgi:hypothetical protein